MKTNRILCRLSMALLALTAAHHATAQTAAPAASCERTRAEVRDECRSFMRTHRWDEQVGDYVPLAKGQAKGPVKPPEGVMTREEVRAERDRFMRTHRWNEQTAQWESLGPTPRELSTLTREQVRKETAAFLRTHVWNEATGAYVDRPPAKKKG